MRDGEAAPARCSERDGERAVSLAYRLVGARDRTEAELRAGLERRRVPAEAVDFAVEELARGGYLDDAGYAARFADDKRNLEGWGRERIARALRRRGVGDEDVEAALGGSDTHSELQRARELLERHYRGGLADDRERGRALRMLLAKGYDVDLAYEAVRAHASPGPG